MEIPHNALTEHALVAVIEEYITREGTDYGEVEFSLAQKVEQVRQQLMRGEIRLNFDPQSQTCQLAPRQGGSVEADTVTDETISELDNEQ